MQYHKHSQSITAKRNHRMQRSYGYYPSTLQILTVFITIFTLLSCGQKTSTFTPEERKRADSLVNTVTNTDSLALLQKQLEKKGDKLGSIIALREWGKNLRNESRFEEALKVHSKGQIQAEDIKDTLEWVQALNNIGTDYRRIGILDVAQDYHYRAWMLSKESTDTSLYCAKKPCCFAQRTG